MMVNYILHGFCAPQNCSLPAVTRRSKLPNHTPSDWVSSWLCPGMLRDRLERDSITHVVIEVIYSMTTQQ